MKETQVAGSKFGFLIPVLSLLPTPLLLFVSSAVPLYLANQAELNYQLRVLLPFALLAALTFFFGALIWRIARTPMGSLLLWLYYLAGPAVSAYSLLRSVSILHLDMKSGVAVYAVLYLVVAVLIARRHKAYAAAHLFALMGVVFVLIDCVRFATGLEYAEQNPGIAPADYGLKDRGSTLPNIYHLIFDEYQSDFFAMQLNGQLETDLSGFVFYPNAAALYENTVWSVPSVFLGEEHDLSQSPLEYQQRALNSGASFLASLNSADYSSLAIIRKIYSFKLEQFDVTVAHSFNIDSRGVDNGDAFISLWIYRVAPRFLSNALAFRGIFLDRQLLNNLGAKTFLADSAPQESVLSFNKYLRQEQFLPGHGRYTFIHLLLPHSPYVFNSSCESAGKSSIKTQSRCASYLLVKFVEELKRLERFEKSLIIVHGDHGARLEEKEGQWVAVKRRSHRSLLLIKPAGVGSAQPLSSNVSDVSLVDIAPGIRSFVHQRAASTEDLPWWESSDDGFGNRIRHYYSAENDVLLRRFKIEQQQLVFDEDIPIDVTAHASQEDVAVTPVVPINTIVEAEDGLLSSAAEVHSDLADTYGSYVTSGTKSYRFELSEDSRIHLEVRAITPNGNGNSCYLRMNTQRVKAWHMPISRNWQWRSSDEYWNLKKGTHMISLEYREPIYLDQIKIVATPVTG